MANLIALSQKLSWNFNAQKKTQQKKKPQTPPTWSLRFAEVSNINVSTTSVAHQPNFSEGSSHNIMLQNLISLKHQSFLNKKIISEFCTFASTCKRRLSKSPCMGMLALVAWQVNWNSNPAITNMVFTRHLPSVHFTFYAVSKLPGFVQNIAPFTHFRCSWKALFVSSTAKTCSNRSFEFRGHVVSQMAVIFLQCGWDECSMLAIFWSLGAIGWWKTAWKHFTLFLGAGMWVYATSGMDFLSAMTLKMRIALWS